MVHEGGWTISKGADGELLFHTPSGELLARNPQPEPVDDAVGWMREWADEQGLELSSETNYPLWDGSRPDYDLAISGVLDD